MQATIYPRSCWALGHTSATELRLPSCLRWSCSLIGMYSECQLFAFLAKAIPPGFWLSLKLHVFSVTDFFPPVFDGLLSSFAFLTALTVIVTSEQFTGPGKWLTTFTSARTIESHKTEQGSSRLVSKSIRTSTKSIMEEQFIDRISSIWKQWKFKPTRNNKCWEIYQIPWADWSK